LGILVPALTAVGGYLLAGLNEDARDRRAASREAAARQASLVERHDERMHEFQRELLLELQVVLQRQVRATARILLQDQKTLREQGKLAHLPAEINQDSYDTGVELARLTVRVLDDDLRHQLEGWHTFTSGLDVLVFDLNELTPAKAIELLSGYLGELSGRYLAVNETLGVLLRSELGRIPDLPTG
jgi:hypothetical protein